MAVLPGISADHIAPAGGAFEPARKNNFTIIVPFGTTEIQMALASCPLPKPGVGELTIPYGNEERFVAGVAKFDAVALVVKDFVRHGILRAVRQWRTMVYDPRTGAIGWARNYKKTCDIVMFGPDGSHWRVWRCIGVWPSRLNEGDFKMSESADNNRIEMTLEMDKAVYLGYAGGR